MSENKPEVKNSTPKAHVYEALFGAEKVPNVSSPELHRHQIGSWKIFQALQFPDREDKKWQKTDISNLEIQRLNLNPVSLQYINHDAYQHVFGAEMPQFRNWIKFTDNQILTDQDVSNYENGVIFTDIQTAAEKYPDLLLRYFGKIVDPEFDKFSAMNAAFFTKGVFLYVPKGLNLTEPFFSQFWRALKNDIDLTRLLIWVDEGASVTFFYESSSKADLENTQTLQSHVTEIVVGKNAKLNYFQMQSEDNNVWLVSHEGAKLHPDSKLNWVSVDIGAKFVKKFFNVTMEGLDAELEDAGMYICGNNQEYYFDTQQNHQAEKSKSDLIYKGAILDEGKAVWKGMIYVSPDAQKSDGYQKNENLILGENAKVISIPGLEILANDVRCSHGATVGKIDDDQLFYLLSRGIPEELAKQILVQSFFQTVFERISIESIQEYITEKVFSKIKKILY